MSKVPAELRYAKSHEWVRIEADGTATIGITDHAQDALGDLVYVELPEVGASLATEAEAGVVESVKAASDIYSPVAGEVVAVNTALADEPELVNKEPYTSGWLFRLKLADKAEVDGLLSAAEYEAQQHG